MRTVARFLIVLSALIPGLFPTRTDADVMISELCDPRNNYLTDRFLEVYNPDDAAADLAGWSLVAIANGVPVFTWNLSGLILPGQALVAGCATTVTDFPVTFADDGWSTSNGNWNGKVGDGAKLLGPGGVLIDYVVATGTAFENADYVRKPEILAPSVTYDPAQWTSTAVLLATDASPEVHNEPPPAPGPVISVIFNDPTTPLADSEVDVLADVADTTATIVSVTALWGLSPSAISIEIPMVLVSGIRYATSSPIPPQIQGGTVYYQVRAVSDLPATVTSGILSYTLPYELTISQIQGAAASSPYNGSLVLTRGVVTARYGSYFVVQDGTGPWNGVWARAAIAPAAGDSILFHGRVVENDSAIDAGNTLLVDAVVLVSSPGAAVPMPVTVSTAAAMSESHEGVLVRLSNPTCTDPSLGYGEWEVNDGSGPARVNDLAYHFDPTLGTSYEVSGPVGFSSGSFKLEPRGAVDVVWVGDLSAPVIFYATTITDTTVVVTFSEEVEEATAETSGNYDLDGLTAIQASLDPDHRDQVFLIVPPMAEGSHLLTVDGVADLYGNVTDGAARTFVFNDNSIPAGYYASAEGLVGTQLKGALHNIIKNHTVRSYDYAWTAFYTTDDKPNGKVWDVYSDIPGGIPPYEYTFGVDQGGIGGQEGTGYSREHSFPRGWFGGEVSPMNSDLFILYPTDTHVNGSRGSNAYGETAAPDWTSLNGSMRGPSSVAGYTGIVFEPIDDFKGDLARAYFYVSTRYYTEDAAWPGGPMTTGAELQPWASTMLLQWHFQDPVSQKEIDRNGAIYDLQYNRNPFVDRPEFVGRMFMVADAGDFPPAEFDLDQNRPNPFYETTRIDFTLPHRTDVDLAIYDVCGRLVRSLASGPFTPGSHHVVWNGCDAAGRSAGSGVYFYRLRAAERTETRKLQLAR